MIPLLSGKPLVEFTPEEYHLYIRSLYRKKEVKKVEKRLRDYVITVKRTKKGKLSVITKRDPKYITEEEFKSFSTLAPENELFIFLRGKGILLMSHDEAEGIKKNKADIPWGDPE